MFGKLETGNKERISGSIPVQIGSLKLETPIGTFPCKAKIFRNRVKKAIINGVK
jgi:hypothetical protein